MQNVTVRLDAFEGPLDLLYHLIEKNEIDIYDIPIASLTEQYLAYLEAAEDRNMDGISEFLLMAATLLEIKSKMLLPTQTKEVLEEEAIDPRAELVERLLEYKKIKHIANDWKTREEHAAMVFYKQADKAIAKLRQKEEQPLEDFLMGVTMEDLYHVFQEVMARKEAKVDHVRSSFRAVERELFTIQDKMEYIRDLLILQPKIVFTDMFRRKTRKIEKVVTFLALLELIKRKEVQIYQEKIFSQIIIENYQKQEKGIWYEIGTTGSGCGIVVVYIG